MAILVPYCVMNQYLRNILIESVFSELESEKSDDPGGGAGDTNNTTTTVGTGSMVQVGGGGATAVAASLMRERIEIINSQSQIEEIQSNMWNRPPTTTTTNNEQSANNEVAISGESKSTKVVSAS